MKKIVNKKINKGILVSVFSVVMIICLVTISFAWLTYWNKLNSISVLQIPSKISISGANRSEMQKISLEMTSADTQEDGRITIRRVFCIESTDDYYLEVAHTTNISDMEIKIFPVSETNSEPEKTGGAVQGTDPEAGKVFYYDPDDKELKGRYLNKDGSIANNNLHESTYSKSENNVQQNAEPLYWLTDDVERCEKDGYSRKGTASDGTTDIYYRYYILQLSWSTQDTEETDIVYLLASHRE